MRKELVFSIFIFWVSAAMAKPYSVIQYWFSAQDCDVFIVQIWDDNGTNDPTNDVLITTGTVSNCREAFELDDLKPNSLDITHMHFSSAAQELKSEPTLKLYPNPATRTVTVETDLTSASELMITDLSGATSSSSLEVLRVSDNPLVIDVSKLSPGMYILHVREGDLVKHSRLVIH